jgi:hypothetical protein
MRLSLSQPAFNINLFSLFLRLKSHYSQDFCKAADSFPIFFEYHSVCFTDTELFPETWSVSSTIST